MNLDGRCLGAKREAVGRVERAGRVVFGNVERVEVVEVRFDLAAVFDRVSKRYKDIFQTFA